MFSYLRLCHGGLLLCFVWYSATCCWFSSYSVFHLLLPLFHFCDHSTYLQLWTVMPSFQIVIHDARKSIPNCKRHRNNGTITLKKHDFHCDTPYSSRNGRYTFKSLDHYVTLHFSDLYASVSSFSLCVTNHPVVKQQSEANSGRFQ